MLINQLGFSGWSAWCEAVRPTAGAYVQDFTNNGNRALLRLGWFKPLLQAGRKVTGYEVQMAIVQGAMQMSIAAFEHKTERTKIGQKKKLITNDNDDHIDEDNEKTSSGFETLRDNVQMNEIEIPDLRAGTKYQFRVRPQIDRKFLDWEFSILSNFIVVPSCAPDAPFDLKVALLPVDGVDGDEGDCNEGVYQTETTTATSTGDSWQPTTESMTTASMTDAVLDQQLHLQHTQKKTRKGCQRFQISHNSIVIQWVNGSSNGAPVLEYQFECAKIRDYRPNDMNRANRAAGLDMQDVGNVDNVDLIDEEEFVDLDNVSQGDGFEGADDFEGLALGMSLSTITANTSMGDVPIGTQRSSHSVGVGEGRRGDGGGEGEERRGDGGDSRAGASAMSASMASHARSVSSSNVGQGRLTLSESIMEGDGDDSSTLAANIPWMDVTKRGDLLGPLAFRVNGLHPGASYIFRLRQRNAVGWSPFSMASRLVRTLFSVPPSKPSLVEAHPFHLVIRWDELTGGNEDGGLPLTGVDYELEVGRLPLVYNPGLTLSPVVSVPTDKKALYASLQWERAESRIVSEPIVAAPAGGGFIPHVKVLVDTLSPGAGYMFRVKVLTVAGWSTWSEVSDEIRTTSSS